MGILLLSGQRELLAAPSTSTSTCSSGCVSPPPDSKTARLAGVDPEQCVKVCEVLHPQVRQVGVLGDGDSTECWCVYAMIDTREVGPALYCDRQCGGLQCGGRHHGRVFYSLYCLHQGRLAWGHDTQANFSHRTESRDEDSWTMMERLSTLGTESVIIVTLMASTSVLLLATIVFLYLGNKMDKATASQDSNIPILNLNGKSYGSNSTEFTQQGKSKFYSVKEEDQLPEETRKGKSKFYSVSEEVEDTVPEENREGKSRFYRQEALEVKSPERERERDGFQEIFNSD